MSNKYQIDEMHLKIIEAAVRDYGFKLTKRSSPTHCYIEINDGDDLIANGIIGDHVAGSTSDHLLLQIIESLCYWTQHYKIYPYKGGEK